MNNVINLYTKMLASAGMVVDNQGFVSSLTPGADTSKPVFVGDKRLVLPFKEQLDQPDWSNRAGFHPLLQNFSTGDSPVFDTLRTRVNRHFDFVFGMTFLDLAQLAAEDDHKNLSPEQAKYLRVVSVSDDKFVKVLRSIVAAKPSVKKGFEFVRFNVVMGRNWEGRKRNRVAVASFPLYEQLPREDKPATIAGQKLSIKQVKMLRDMYEFLFPHIKEKGYYESGSDSKFGPSIESLYQLLDGMIRTHNGHIAILDGAIKGAEYLYIPNEWSDLLNNIPALTSEIRAIPALEGNAGRSRIASNVSPAMVSENAPVSETTPTVIADKASSVPIITNTPAMNQAIHQQAQERPRVRLGVAPADAVDSRTQLPDNVTVASPRPAINLSGFQPTPMVGTQLQAMQQSQQATQPMQPAQFGAVGNVLSQPSQPMQANGQPVITKIPESARMINGQMYIPLEVQGAAVPPQGSMLIDNRLYVPYLQGGAVPIAQMQQSPMMRPGMPGQITDPSQIPGLSPGEVDMYRANPVLFQNFLQSMQAQQTNQFAAQQMQRQQQVAPYMQRLINQAQQVQQQNRFGMR